MKITHYIKEYGGLLNKGELRENITVSLDGQILNKMSSSDSKRFFYDLLGGSSKVQIVADPSCR
ncbi:lysine--tRNA ligase [Pyrus ussuriensis x Pyrus communis]|uniref:Lysine--tRNA ligase n=1 Tax=Pyrus ussuriensis x Pyrus communis TaxID=2448454 RepID=A0A5N5IQY6_9ROSA|nr:lysine--tRNA ligase [Pyrus ussuriensis x Pyrus communis]